MYLDLCKRIICIYFKCKHGIEECTVFSFVYHILVYAFSPIVHIIKTIENV